MDLLGDDFKQGRWHVAHNPCQLILLLICTYWVAGFRLPVRKRFIWRKWKPFDQNGIEYLKENSEIQRKIYCQKFKEKNPMIVNW